MVASPGRDLEAMAQGFEEVVDHDYLEYRIRSTQYVGEKLLDAGVSIVQPPGGHAIYIDAGDFCRAHYPSRSFPGKRLAVAPLPSCWDSLLRNRLSDVRRQWSRPATA